MNEFIISKNYKKDASTILSGMYTIVPSMVYFYDSGSLTDTAVKLLTETQDITEAQTKEIIKNNIVGYNEVNYVGSGDGFTEITLMIQGSDQTLDSDFNPKTIPNRAILRFERAIVLYDMYELTPANTIKTKVKSCLPLGVYVLGKPISLDVNNITGLYGGSTSWSGKIYIGYNNTVYSENSGKGNGNTVPNITIKNEDVEAYSNLLRKMGTLINSYSENTKSYQAYVDYIKDISDKFTKEKHINVPYMREGNWYVNGKLVQSGDSTTRENYVRNIENIYQEYTEEFNKLKQRTEIELNELKEFIVGTGNLKARIEKIENDIVNNFNTYITFSKNFENTILPELKNKDIEIDKVLVELRNLINHLTGTVVPDMEVRIRKAYTELIENKINTIKAEIVTVVNSLNNKADQAELQATLDAVDEKLKNFGRTVPSQQTLADFDERIKNNLSNLNTLSGTISGLKSKTEDLSGKISNLETGKSSVTKVKELEDQLKTLEQKIKNSPSIPIGMIALWSGNEDTIPNGWQRVRELDGRFPVGVGSSNDISNNGHNFAIREMGGEYKHKLTENEMPRHIHNIYIKNAHVEYGGSDRGDRPVSLTPDGQVGTDKVVQATGGDVPHNNIPPFYGVYFIRYIGV